MEKAFKIRRAIKALRKAQKEYGEVYWRIYRWELEGFSQPDLTEEDWRDLQEADPARALMSQGFTPVEVCSAAIVAYDLAIARYNRNGWGSVSMIGYTPYREECGLSKTEHEELEKKLRRHWKTAG